MNIKIGTKRHLAGILDLFIVGLPFYLIALLFNLNPETDNFYLVNVIAWLAYCCAVPHWVGASLGQYALNLKMTDSRTGARPSIKSLIVRTIMFLTVLTGIGYLIFLFTGFYWDRISKTSVIETKGNIKNMINFVKNNKLLIWGGLLGIIFFSLFYWFRIRPSKAYGECSRIAEDEAKAKFPVAWQTTSNYRDFYNLIYSQCLRNKGIDQ